MSQSQQIDNYVSTFVEDLTTMIERSVHARLLASIGNGAPTKRGRPPSISTSRKPNPKRRKGPIQLCPVPGCKGRAAPVFGMVCSDHKDVPKAKIKAYRLARKAKKSGEGATSPRSKRKGITLSKKSKSKRAKK